MKSQRFIETLKKITKLKEDYMVKCLLNKMTLKDITKDNQMNH